MSTALATKTNGDHAAPDVEAIEKVMLNGDLSQLTPPQRIAWYKTRCEAAGLDPRAQPFQYLTLNGKLVLYATKAASDTLAASHKLTVEIVEHLVEPQTGVCRARCRVTFPDGHHVEDIGAVSIMGMKGDALCNALMKVVTKAKRRTILSALGLGMLDESELETITPQETSKQAALPGPEKIDNGSGHGRGSYASPEQIQVYREKLEGFVVKVNAEWADRWTNRETGECPADLKAELVNPWQIDGHLVKWAVQSGRLDAKIIPEQVKTRQLGAYVAVVYHRGGEDRRALVAELRSYAEECARLATEAWYRKHPESMPDEGDVHASAVGDDEAEAVPVGARPDLPSDDEDADPDTWPAGRE